MHRALCITQWFNNKETQILYISRDLDEKEAD